jgi:hypothetical protein
MDESLSTYLPGIAADSGSVLRSRNTQQKLESSIFNSVSLGQWETARASFQCLSVSQEAGVRDNAKELLKILLLDAAKFWLVPINSLWLCRVRNLWCVREKFCLLTMPPPPPPPQGEAHGPGPVHDMIEEEAWPILGLRAMCKSGN